MVLRGTLGCFVGKKHVLHNARRAFTCIEGASGVLRLCKSVVGCFGRKNMLHLLVPNHQLGCLQEPGVGCFQAPLYYDPLRHP